MTELSEKKCVPCEGGVAPLTRAEAREAAAQARPGLEARG